MPRARVCCARFASQAVDAVLAGGQAPGQMRERTADGEVLKYTQVGSGMLLIALI